MDFEMNEDAHLEMAYEDRYQIDHEDEFFDDDDYPEEDDDE